MNLCLINHSFRYEIEKLIRLFLPFEKLEYFEEAVFEDNTIITEIKGNLATAKVVISGDEAIFSEIITNPDDFDEQELRLASALFSCLTQITEYKPEWGMLTGVRPAKLYSRLIEEMGKEKAEEYLKNTLKVADNKMSLCKATNISEKKIIDLSDDNSFSLYVSIPFCPSRCSYCSFVSHSVEAAKKLIPDYLEKLCEEIKATAKIAKSLNLNLKTIYIGGGTPTTLTAEQLKMLLTVIKENFDFSNLLEYTVEAGRPDTITVDKLSVIKELGATRISINPQTMNDDVLKTISRRHTASDTVKAFEMARKCGHTNINMDLIAGLPTDTLESFKDTISKILALSPESVTVHSLSMKRSSTLNVKARFPELEMGSIATDMVNFARYELTKSDILPYYMYRQSKTVGNLENVGYAKAGYESFYNVYIMDETHTILGCGASAVTKLKQPSGPQISRIFNYKYPYEYINDFDVILQRKSGIKEFYKNYI